MSDLQGIPTSFPSAIPSSIPSALPSAPPISPSSVSCIGCGYDLSGTAIGSTCPECGTPVSSTLQSRTAGERSCGSATACFVLGIISIAGCALTGPVAILVYFRARRELSRGGYAKSAHTFAKVGLILGIISTALFGLYLMFVLGLGILG